MLKTVAKLVINKRLEHDDPFVLEHNKFLNILRDGKCTNYDWCHYSNSGSKYLISAEEWEQFSGDNVVCIYSKKIKMFMSATFNAWKHWEIILSVSMLNIMGTVKILRPIKQVDWILIYFCANDRMFF